MAKGSNSTSTKSALPRRGRRPAFGGGAPSRHPTTHRQRQGAKQPAAQPLRAAGSEPNPAGAGGVRRADCAAELHRCDAAALLAGGRRCRAGGIVSPPPGSRRGVAPPLRCGAHPEGAPVRPQGASLTWLTHLVAHYDDLPRHVIFAKARPAPRRAQRLAPCARGGGPECCPPVRQSVRPAAQDNVRRLLQPFGEHLRSHLAQLRAVPCLGFANLAAIPPAAAAAHKRSEAGKAFKGGCASSVRCTGPGSIYGADLGELDPSSGLLRHARLPLHARWGQGLAGGERPHSGLTPAQVRGRARCIHPLPQRLPLPGHLVRLPSAERLSAHAADSSARSRLLAFTVRPVPSLRHPMRRCGSFSRYSCRACEGALVAYRNQASGLSFPPAAAARAAAAARGVRAVLCSVRVGDTTVFYRTPAGDCVALSHTQPTAGRVPVAAAASQGAGWVRRGWQLSAASSQPGEGVVPHLGLLDPHKRPHPSA